MDQVVAAVRSFASSFTRPDSTAYQMRSIGLELFARAVLCAAGMALLAGISAALFAR